MFGKVLKKLIDYKHSKNWFSSLALRGALVMFFFSTLSFAQIRLTERQYSRVKMGDDPIGKYETKQEAVNIGLQLKAQNPDKRVIVQMYDTQDFLIRNIDLKRIDTIKLSRRIDVDSLPVRAFRDMVIDGYYYVLFQNEGMIKFTTDSLPRNKIEYVFERVKTHGKSTYKALNNSPGTGVLNGVEIE